MPSLSRFVRFASLVLLLASPLPSWAAGSARVLSSVTRIELASDGSARVRHELRVETTSGSLQSLTVEGLDADAEPLPDARITRTDLAPGPNTPQPLELRLEQGRATLSVGQRKGVPGKSFAIEFGYQTQLSSRGLIRDLPQAQRSELTWSGPGFQEGLDSATLIVRVAAASVPPEAVDTSAEAARPQGSGSTTSASPTGSSPANSGIIMSTLRRSADQDELEVVRAHVARHEAPRWRIRLDRTLFAGSAPSAGEPAPLAVEPSEEDLDGIWPAPERGLRRLPASRMLPFLLAAALGYACLVAAKGRAVARASALRNCQVRALVAGRTALHASLAGLLLLLASGAVIWLDAPVPAALALLLALLLASHRPPTSEARLRGPGEWQALDSSALEPVAAASPRLPGAWLDVGRARGFSLLLGLLGLATAAALRVFETSPYHGACLLLGSTALLPVFCTGRSAELPEPALARSRRFLARVHRRLKGRSDLMVQALGRFCAGANELDELRLAIHPARGLPGLIGMELALELRPGLAGQSAAPVIVIRTADGSPCQHALPRQLSWSRGRTAEERAALVRPKLPSVALSVELVLELAARASESPAPSAERVSASAPPRRRLRASPAAL
ncbi:MAG: hypothetical protein ABI895_27515 [Deltaproteobacteria bacterium]